MATETETHRPISLASALCIGKRPDLTPRGSVSATVGITTVDESSYWDEALELEPAGLTYSSRAIEPVAVLCVLELESLPSEPCFINAVRCLIQRF